MTFALSHPNEYAIMVPGHVGETPFGEFWAFSRLGVRTAVAVVGRTGSGLETVALPSSGSRQLALVMPCRDREKRTSSGLLTRRWWAGIVRLRDPMTAPAVHLTPGSIRLRAYPPPPPRSIGLYGAPVLGASGAQGLGGADSSPRRCACRGSS